MALQPLKVTLLSLPFPAEPSGGVRVMYEYANRLAARGHEVLVVHGWAPPRLAETWGLGPPPELRPPPYWCPVHDRVSVEHRRIVDSSTLPPADFLVNVFEEGVAPASSGAPVLMVQGYGFYPSPLVDAKFRTKARKICVSRWLCDVVRGLGVPENEIAYVPNGVDPAEFRVSRPIDGRPRRVAMLYSPLAAKGAEVGLAALASVRARLPDVEAVLFGTVERPSDLPDWITYRQLPSRSELADGVYNASAVLVCPSRTEGFYLCGLEAMACGCAFASTDVGGVRDYAEHEVTALISPTENAEALADSTVRLLVDDELRHRLAEAGVGRAREFSWERSIDRLEAHLLRWRAE